MISTIINQIDNSIDYIESKWGLIELFQQEERPLFYCSNGEYKEVIDFDKYAGVSYWRKTSNVLNEKVENLYSTEDLYQRTYNLRNVYVVKREALSTDNNYSIDNLGDKIMLDIDNLSNSVRNTLKLSLLEIEVSEIITNRTDLLEEEMEGVEELHHKFILLGFDIAITAQFTKGCLATICD